MPSNIIWKGQSTAVPGVLSQLIPDAAGAVGPAPRGTVAILGDLATLEPQTLWGFTTAGNLIRSVDPCEVRKAGEMAFKPTNDRRITGLGAAAVVAVGVVPRTAAFVILENADGPAIKITATIFGIPSNRVTCEVENGTTQGKKVTIGFDGTTVVHDDIGGIGALQLSYDPGGDADVMNVEIAPATGLTIKYSTDQTGGGSYVPTKMVFQGTIKFDLSAPVVGDQDIDIVGEWAGTPVSETVTVLDGTDTVTTTNQFSNVSSIDLSNIPGGTTVTISGTAIFVDFAENDTIQKVIDFILSRGGTQGFDADSELPYATTYASSNLDTVSSGSPTSIVSATLVDFTADLALMIDTLNVNNEFVNAEAQTPGTGAPDNTSGTIFLSGGTTGSASAQDWQDGLDLLKDQSITGIVIMSTDGAIREKLRAHCAEMEDVNERWGFCAMPANSTKTDIKDAARALNSRFLTLAWQEIEHYYAGQRVWSDPLYFAAQIAGMFAGRPIGYPLTWKYPLVLDFRQNSGITLPDDANEMLNAGTIFLTRDVDLGFIQITRDVTTYLQDDIPEYSALSASESGSESLRDLRRVLKAFIGETNYSGSDQMIKAVAQDRLNRQRDRNDLAIIKDWSSLEVEDLGDRILVSYAFAALEGITWVTIRAYVNRNNVAA